MFAHARVTPCAPSLLCVTASKAYLNAMYECVKHHKGISFPVEWKDVFLALAQVLGGGRADVVNFFFDLYDLDGSGDVSREEVRLSPGRGGAPRCTWVPWVSRPHRTAVDVGWRHTCGLGQVTRMLMLGKAAANSSAATVAKLLQRLDIDGDGGETSVARVAAPVPQRCTC